MLTGYPLFAGILIACFFFWKEKDNVAIGFLLISSLVTYILVARLDPFLNLWDERFHALVAKNLMNHPLMPTLYDNPVVNMAYDRWDRYHIWLHKEPLFLWQIALSYKLFGVNEFALRLPSAVMGSFLVVFGFRTGKLLISRLTGFLSAVFIASSFYLVGLISGRQELDHNDLAFLFYVSASFWCWIEFIYSKEKSRKYFVVLTGLFAGMAILCKWLPGLIVYFGWGLYNLLKFRFKLKAYLPMVYALVITAIVSIPWQILSYQWFPAEKHLEMEIYSGHFTKALDGHSGTIWYHFGNIGLLFGLFAPWLILPGMYLFFRKVRDKKLAVSIMAIPVVVFLFYTLAKTKMPSFPIIAMLPVSLFLACVIDYAVKLLPDHLIKKNLIKLLITIIILVISWFNLNLNKINEIHSPDSDLARMLTHNKEIFLKLNKILPQDAVVFNVKGRHYIECMFYTPFPAYNFIPTVDQFEDLKRKGKIVAIFKTGDLPDYILNDPQTIIISDLLEGYD